MIPTKQTVLHDPDNGKIGNCFSAVLASLLHLPIEEVPLFVDPDTWLQDLNKWLKQFGLAFMVISNLEDVLNGHEIEGLWHEVSGKSSRSHDIFHSCIGYEGKVYFDPHPDSTGLHEIHSCGVFVALEPWICTEKGDSNNG